MNKIKYTLLFTIGLSLSASAASNSDLIKLNCIKDENIVQMMKEFYSLTTCIQNMLNQIPKEKFVSNPYNEIQKNTIENLLEKTVSQTKTILNAYRTGKPYTLNQLITWAHKLWFKWYETTSLTNMRNPINIELASLHKALIQQKSRN